MKFRSINRLLVLVLLAGYATTGLAERADRDKPVHLESDHMRIDDANQVSVFTGNVVLTQGTLMIRGDQIVVVQDKRGFKHGTATGNLASFRQKREGLDEYVEGYGERIEYDTGTEIMDIYGKARVKRGLDDVRGEHITYNSRTEVFQVNSRQDQQAPAPGKGRVRAVIQPKDKPISAEPPADEALSIKPDATLPRPEGK